MELGPSPPTQCKAKRGSTSFLQQERFISSQPNKETRVRLKSVPLSGGYDRFCSLRVMRRDRNLPWGWRQSTMWLEPGSFHVLCATEFSPHSLVQALRFRLWLHAQGKLRVRDLQTGGQWQLQNKSKLCYIKFEPDWSDAVSVMDKLILLTWSFHKVYVYGNLTVAGSRPLS